MPRFEGVELTQFGNSVYTHSIVTGTPITITRIALGDGFLPAGVTYDDLNALVNEIYQPTEIRKTIKATDLAELEFDYSSAITTEGIWFRELGIFAQNPQDPSQEGLYAVENVGKFAEYIPPIASATYIKRILRLLIKIANAAQVQIIYESFDDLQLQYIIDHFVAIEGQTTFIPATTRTKGALEVIIEGAISLDWQAINEQVQLNSPLPAGTNVWLREVRLLDQ
jgi:hypothetical protein